MSIICYGSKKRVQEDLKRRSQNEHLVKPKGVRGKIKKDGSSDQKSNCLVGHNWNGKHFSDRVYLVLSQDDLGLARRYTVMDQFEMLGYLTKMVSRCRDKNEVEDALQYYIDQYSRHGFFEKTR